LIDVFSCSDLVRCRLIALASLGAVPALAQDAASAPPVAAQEAAPAAPAAAVGTETKENPYGLMNLIKNGPRR
jgi:hypothetical protein